MGRSQSQNQRLVTVYDIEITAEAEQEISEAVQWYAAKDRQTAEVFKTIVFESIGIISHSPLSWAQVSDDGIRRFVLPRYPYKLFFTVMVNTVRILAVAHNRRTPDYWRKN